MSGGPLKSRVKFHFVYRPHLVYPHISRWTLKVPLHFGSNNAITNMSVQISLWVSVFNLLNLSCYLMVILFLFLRNLHSVSHIHCIILHPHQGWGSNCFTFSLIFTFSLSLKKIVAILIDRKWYYLKFLFYFFSRLSLMDKFLIKADFSRFYKWLQNMHKKQTYLKAFLY